jgi:hypothetical protein
MSRSEGVREEARRAFVLERFRCKPEFGKRYEQWLDDRFDYSAANFGEVDYYSVARDMRAAFCHSSFWHAFCLNIHDLDQQFRYKAGTYLFQRVGTPSISIKTFDSFLRKTHRFNVADNCRWPNQPDLGWISPANWYEAINDIVRGQLVMRHMDGAKFLSQYLQELASQHSVRGDVRYHADPDGYYAIHFYTSVRSNVLRRSTGSRITVCGQVELQITTQLHETVKQLLHHDYRRRRSMLKRHAIPWQWRPDSDEFMLNSLGHVLQNVDGIIVRLHTQRSKEP